MGHGSLELEVHCPAPVIGVKLCQTVCPKPHVSRNAGEILALPSLLHQDAGCGFDRTRHAGLREPPAQKLWQRFPACYGGVP